MLSYVHIPFCHRVCPYCSFYKHTPGGTSIGRFVDSLIREARHRVQQPPRSLYFGGGTPSMLSPGHLRQVFGGLAEVIPFGTLDELTLEANPATFDQQKAHLFRQLGVRRVSLGIQSFESSVLATLGREHSPEEAAESVSTLKAVGMPSINVDLMFSIPGMTLEMWRSTLATAIALEPDHISAYNLNYEEDTAFFEALKRGELDADEDRDAEQFHLADEMLTAAGYEHYETSNYSRPGHHSSHNRGYWKGEDYLGLGPSAVSTLGKVRTTNIADTERYIQMVDQVGHATVESEALTEAQLRLERIALLLRTRDGVPLELLASEVVTKLVDEGLGEQSGDAFVLTRKGSALVDPIAAELA